MGAALASVVDATGAKLAAIAGEDGVTAAAGDFAGDADLADLCALIAGDAGSVRVGGRARAAESAPIGSGRGDHLVVVREGTEAFEPEAAALLRAMARTLAIGLKLLHSIGEERHVRERAEAEMKVRKRAESKYRNLVERLPAIVYTAEPGEFGVWRYVSPQVEEILGYTREEWLADPGLWARCLHPGDRDRVVAHEMTNYAGFERNAPAADYRMITRDGDVVWILDEAVQEPDEHGTVLWHGVMYDITERKEALQEAEHRAAQQAAVASLGERALEGADLDDLIRAAVHLVTQVEDVEHGCVWEMPAKGRSLQLRAGLESPDGIMSKASATRDSHAGAAYEAGLHVIVDDWRTESRFSMPPALRVLGVRSSLAVVIPGQRRPFGVIDVHSSAPGRFTPADVHFVQSVANVLADAIERRLADEALRYRVLHDALTALPNKVLFGDTLHAALKRCAESGAPIGVLFLDLDHFKLVNDSLGHQAGDDLLRAVAPRLRSRLRPGDTVARFGGDEFGVLVEDLADEEEALAVAERISTAFARPFVLQGVEHFMSASIGVAVARPGGEEGIDADGLIRDADAAMYRAKEKGRARVELFDADMRARAVRRLEVERELRHALERDELTLQYQPIIALATGRISGVEALVRWRHPDRGLLQPDEFIDIAEETGLVEPIGRWVTEQACRQALVWHELRPDERPLDVSVNVSARQFAHRDLPEVISEILVRTGLDAASLRLEITESVLVEESGHATATLEALKELGVNLVLDDFGTGYSALAYLNRFPLDALKIDRSFIEALGVQQERSAIVEAIVGMSRALSLDVIAEGVESELQLSEIRALGCPYAQGFYFARPLSGQQLTSLLVEEVDFSELIPAP